MPALIGVDFDNTIVCYDELFYETARKVGLVSESVERSKTAVRAHVRSRHSDEKWALLQSEVYGARLFDAPPYPGVVEFFQCCRDRSIPVCVVSHKSRFPAAGDSHDFHRSALEWLEEYGFFSASGNLVPRDHVYFTATREEKIRQIVQLGCTHFVDDLPEVFCEAGFPNDVKKILFDPTDAHRAWNGGVRAPSWAEVKRQLPHEVAA